MRCPPTTAPYVALLGVAVAALAVVATGTAPAEIVRHTCVPKSAELRFEAADGTRLAGYRLGRGSTAVILGHQTRSTSCQWAPYARRLARLGYLVVAVDFRGHGDSQVRSGRAGGRLAADLGAAVSVARKRGARKVFVLGASMGGTAGLAAGANAKLRLAGVINASGPATFGWISALELVPRLRVPVLYVVGAQDAGGGFASDAQKLYDATASSDKELHLLDSYRHGVDLVTSDSRARTLVEGFLGSH